MLTNLKKLMALSGAIAILAMNLAPTGVSAAAVNGAAVAVSGNDITISGVTGTTASVRVEKDGVAVGSVTTGTIAAGTLTIADPDGTPASGVDAAYYVITFNTDTDDFGSVTLDNGGTYNKVAVTATVVPTLSLAVVKNNSTLGVLSPGVFSASPVDVDLTYSTNAKTGLSVSMASTGLKDTNVDHEIHAFGSKISAMTTSDGVYTVATAPGAGTANVNSGSPAVAASQVVASTTAPVNAGTTNVKVGAQITNTTVAGNYSDTLTFTVTGTF